MEEDYASIREKKASLARSQAQATIRQNINSQNNSTQEDGSKSITLGEGQQATTSDTQQQQQQQQQPPPPPQPPLGPNDHSQKQSAVENHNTSQNPTALPPTNESAPVSVNEPLNFDSMFPETSNTTLTGSLDMDMGFENDDSGNQAFLDGTNFSMGGAGPKPEAGIGSLLPGLESYASAGGEGFNNMGTGGSNQRNNDNLSSNNNQSSTNNGTQPHHNNSTAAGDDNTMDDLPGQESNFDALFVRHEDYNGGGDNDMLGDVEIGDLDDSWLV